MTISYMLKVASSRFGGFSKLLFRWKGSIYKLLYKEFIISVVLYALLSLVYRRLLTKEQKHLYTEVAQYCNRSTDLIPMSFVLGFYVTLIVNRWWAQYTSIPLPDQLMRIISSNIHGKDERARILRRTLIRYASLLAVLILRSVSTRVLKRLPTMDHVVEAGFMTQDERKKFERLHSAFNKYWIPCVWFTNLAAQARQDGRIHDDVALHLLMDELNLYRAKCSMLFHYDWISIPLVYMQVVTNTVYSFFTFCLIRRQLLEPLEPRQEGDLDMYVPLSTLLQFFYAGWLKVARQIINPFGEDDDDFETNKLIDRNLIPGFYLQHAVSAWRSPGAGEKEGECFGVATAQAGLGAGHPCGGWQPVPVTLLCSPSMCEDVEQSQPAEPSPSMPCIQTPLLSRFFTATSPAISIKNFGWSSRGHPHLQHPWADGGFPSPFPNPSENPESVAHIEEEETEDEEPTMPHGHPGGTQPPEASDALRKELPPIQVKGPSSESIAADRLEAWEP
ncbi:BEST4 protein, partial [Sula dactylatra]|nr:BEST4 protein [Sula dactylatra]